MPVSLLPASAHPAVQERLDRAHHCLQDVFQGWPEGRPNARLLQEYLVGRAAGVLDVSGRARTATVAAEPVAVLVLDDPDGSLSLASASVTAVPHLVRCDSASAARGVLEAVRAADAASQVSVLLDERPDAGTNPFSALVTRLRDMCIAAGVGEPSGAVSGAEQGGAGDLEPRASPAVLRVLIAAPKQVEALRDHLALLDAAASHIRAECGDAESFDLEIVVIGRDKHMTKAFNTELERTSARVDVSPGMWKSRLLVGSGWSAPQRTRLPAPRVKGGIAAYGACFGGPVPDAGARILVHSLRERIASVPVQEAGQRIRALDLGCGNGWLLQQVGQLFPAAELAGVDDSWAAAASARLTLGDSGGGTFGEHDGVTPGGADSVEERPAARILHADGAAQLPWAGGYRAGEWDLVTLNPPFHDGTSVTRDIAHALIDSARELLRPGGLLVLVQNSHLRYRGHLARSFAHVEQWARDPRFTVLAARKASAEER